MTIEAKSSQQILRERARALARVPEEQLLMDATLEVLEFRLAQEHYALETRYVEEIYPFKELTPLPCTPPFVVGIVNVRGRLWPVLDLRKLFHLPEIGLADFHRVILVRGHGLELGILADVMVGIRTISADHLESSLPILAGLPGHYVKGVTEQRLVVIDLGRLLADPQIIVEEEVEA